MTRGFWRSLLLAGALAAPTVASAQPVSEQMGGITQVAPSAEERARVNYDAYILGPGDSLQIELLDLPELSGRFTIGPDGTLYLPRLRALYVEGLTVEELRSFLTQQFSAFVLQPELYVRPVGYRPIRIYVGGEVRRPGYYTLSGNTELTRLSESADAIQTQAGTATEITRPGSGATSLGGNSISTFGAVFPTVFDAIRAAQGITPYSNLGQVEVTRKQPISSGGGRIRAKLNFISLITDGNESQNIRLFDGDVVKVSKSDEVLREQLLKAGQTNLSPQFLEVFVSGRVKMPGGKTLPQGSTLTQAIDMAGGLKVLHGSVEFIRFNREGTIDRRIFRYKPSAPADDYKNPVLMAGDVVRVRESPLSAGVEVLSEITAPAVGVYSVYSLFGGFN